MYISRIVCGLQKTGISEVCDAVVIAYQAVEKQSGVYTAVLDILIYEQHLTWNLEVAWKTHGSES